METNHYTFLVTFVASIVVIINLVLLGLGLWVVIRNHIRNESMREDVRAFKRRSAGGETNAGNFQSAAVNIKPKQASAGFRTSSSIQSAGLEKKPEPAKADAPKADAPKAETPKASGTKSPFK